jgi:hypothetical protein
VLDADHRAPRKQRNTARRIHYRILRESPDAAVAESTVRKHVRERTRQLRLLRRKTLVPQSYSWAQEAQVDWYQAWVDIDDERTRVRVFAMRSIASGAAFHRAYLHATQQAFLEAPIERTHGNLLVIRLPCMDSEMLPRWNPATSLSFHVCQTVARQTHHSYSDSDV